MSDTTPPAQHGEGWIIFAGAMLAFAGVVNFIWGIAAIDNSSFFTDDGRYVLFSNLSTWGWFFLIVGILQFIAAYSIFSGGAFGRSLGSSAPASTR